MRMKKTGTAVLTGKAKIMTVVFALTVFIIGIVCYTAAFAANGNGSFYALNKFNYTTGPQFVINIFDKMDLIPDGMSIQNKGSLK